MSAQDYIIPTKQYPVFKATCTAFGYIETGMYKQWNIKNETTNLVGDTFALNFMDAVRMLHEWIKENEEYVVNYNHKCRFLIEIMDGNVDKFGDPIEREVYSIDWYKVKKYIIDQYK